MKYTLLSALILPLASFFTACSQKATYTPAASAGGQTAVAGPALSRPIPGAGQGVAQMPKATAFKMSGDYADHVAVTPGNGVPLAYFPAPSDISERSAPLQLEGGWWLNRQGISSNSVFTTYTFSEYAALPQTPSVGQLLDSIIPGAKVTEFVVLPYNINEAADHISEINLYLKKI
ncbi:MAG: hypothetical protein K2M10_08895 [Muribaculaceae bacterium]|nr:hypothetical protein [Muribaculaceae bacterium]